MSSSRVTAAVTAENTFTDWLPLNKNERYSVSISGTFTATVTVQRQYSGGDILDIDSKTAADVIDGPSPCACSVRVGVKTGGFTSGTVNVAVYK